MIAPAGAPQNTGGAHGGIILGKTCFFGARLRIADVRGTGNAKR